MLYFRRNREPLSPRHGEELGDAMKRGIEEQVAGIFGRSHREAGMYAGLPTYMADSRGLSWHECGIRTKSTAHYYFLSVMLGWPRDNRYVRRKLYWSLRWQRRRTKIFPNDTLPCCLTPLSSLLSPLLTDRLNLLRTLAMTKRDVG
jgi:hypothetical protein